MTLNRKEAKKIADALAILQRGIKPHGKRSAQICVSFYTFPEKRESMEMIAKKRGTTINALLKDKMIAIVDEMITEYDAKTKTQEKSGEHKEN